MALTEWDTPDKQQHLRELLQKDGRGIPNNLVIDTSIKYSIEKRYPVTRMRYFSTGIDGEATPFYVFVFEENDSAINGFYARPPPRGHDRLLLQSALSDLITRFADRLQRDSGILMLSDGYTRDILRHVLSSLFPSFEDVVPPSTVQVFYMTDEQMQGVKEMKLKSIAGYCVDSVDVEKDAARIHENWIHSPSLESTTTRLLLLPSSVVRDSTTGEAVAWNMSSSFGQCSNLFTIAAHRRKGLGWLAQMNLAKNFVSQGLRPFKYVEVTNCEVLAATMRQMEGQMHRIRFGPDGKRRIS